MQYAVENIKRFMQCIVKDFIRTFKMPLSAVRWLSYSLNILNFHYNTPKRVTMAMNTLYIFRIAKYLLFWLYNTFQVSNKNMQIYFLTLLESNSVKSD